MDLTKQRILEVAGPIFAEKGFRGATVREICDRAGANLAAVNYHFGDKDTLYLETVKHAYRTATERVPNPVWTAQTPPQEKLRDFIRTFLRRSVEDREPSWPCQLIMREMYQPTEGCREFAEGFAKPNFHLLQDILAELLPPDTPAQRRHLIAFSIIGQVLHYRFCRPVATFVVGPEKFAALLDTELLTDHITRFALAALGHGDYGFTQETER